MAGDSAAALKMAIDDSQAAAAVLAWSIGGYDLFIPYLLFHVLAVYVMFMDV